MSASDFCDAWGERACSDEVVSVCQAPDVEDCRAAQRSACLEQLDADDFSPMMASDCLSAVEKAYADADLTADELRTTLRLEAPCDSLIVGPVAEGDDCDEHEDCDTASGFTCVFQADQDMGTCQIPVSVDPGFVDLDGNDWHLDASSPLVDAGTSSLPLSLSTDFELDDRNIGASIDIGADELSDATSGGVYGGLSHTLSVYPQVPSGAELIGIYVTEE